MFLRPIAPPYDPLVWERLPFPEKARLVCRSWALQGYGTPLAVYLVYLLKLVGYVGGWVYFCGFTPGHGRLAEIGAWWLSSAAFAKAILWSALFELLGLGCGSGPLTGRYLPPIGGFLYFLRPGTTKLPLISGAPLIGGIRRNASLSLSLSTLVRPAGHHEKAPSACDARGRLLNVPLTRE